MCTVNYTRIPAATVALPTPTANPKNVFISQEMQERIDFIYYRNAAGLKLHPVQFYLHNEDPYPSDHRLLVASFNPTIGTRFKP